jgi:drug/metabolite transporter (DMT)-like permease
MDLPPELFMGIRFLIAGFMMMSYSLVRKKPFPKWKDVGRYALVGLLQIFAANGIVVYVEQWVYSGITALILAVAPIFMALFELFLPGRARIEWKGWIGLIVGFGGVALLVFSGRNTGSADILGALLLVLAAAFWSAGSIYSKSFPGSGSMLPRIGIQMLVGGFLQCILGLIMGEAARFQFTLQSLGAFLYLVLIGSFLGYGTFVYVMHHWPAAKAGTYAYINPVVAVILGAVILREPVTSLMIVASAIILAGVFLVQLSKYKQKPALESKTSRE